MQQIEAKSSSITIERVWNEPGPKIQVRYRNITQVYFRAIREDWLARHKDQRHQWMNWTDDAQRKALLAKKPEMEWSVALPATDDFRERTEELPAPKDLKPGYYLLLTSRARTSTPTSAT